MSIPSIARPSSLKMSRSPIFYTGKNNTLTNDDLTYMSLNLKIWAGALSSLPAANNYVLSKTYSIDEVINFEVSDLVRSEFSHDFDIYTETGFTQSPYGEVLWVNATGDWTYSDNGAAPTTAPHTTGTANAFLTTKGWTSWNNLHNDQYNTTLLAVARKRYVKSGNYEVLGVYNNATNLIAKATILWNDNSEADITKTLTFSNYTQDAVVYIGVGPQNIEDNGLLSASVKPSQHTDGDYYDIILKNSAGAAISTIRYELTCEPKYTPYQVAFINRYGVADFITFFKASTEQGNFTSESYKRSIYQDGFTSASTQVGQSQSFNTNSRNTITMNTGWVEEAYADVVEDILMSDTIAVLLDGSWVSVQPQRGSVDYYKEVNQKMINYTMTFDIAFNERPLIR
mgnify:CR=1 FL=1|jgi:hypothetical protein